MFLSGNLLITDHYERKEADVPTHAYLQPSWTSLYALLAPLLMPVIAQRP